MAAHRRRIAVIGAGAAGTMAAIFAAGGDAQTILLERTPDGGRKILISGGGRCNVLPARSEESRFVTASPARALIRMLRSWPLREQIPFFERDLGIPLAEEKESAKLFPVSNRARDVRDALLALARRRGVEIRMDSLVADLKPESGRWSIELEAAPPLEADAVIVATGGLSIPRSGSDGIGLSILGRLGHTIHTTYPALTPLTAPASPFTPLSGISLPVTITARSGDGGLSATGGFLFTHRGYSGPSVLDVSHVAVRSLDSGAPPARLTVRWTASDEKAWETSLRPAGSRTVAGALRAEIPDRLAAALCMQAGVDPTRTLAQLRREERIRLIATLTRGDLPWAGHEGYEKAEVTGGGVNLSEIDPTTMESRKHPGLFLCGEILDAFGPIGGHNFQWAWATGRAAGIGASRG